MKQPLVEVCIGSLADAKVAETAGADRLELCAATEIGGLTPSAGLIEAVTEATQLPVMVMIRPRAGGFCYTADEYDTALREAKAALKFDIAGVVFGFLADDGQVDQARCREFVDLAEGRETVFHRAFDVVPDPMAALDLLIQIGVTRVLTSGQRATAVEGAALLRQLREHANDRIQVLPGGGVRAGNIQELERLTGCDQYHVGASKAACDQSLKGNPEISFYSSDYLKDARHRLVEEESVEAVLRKLGRR